MKNTKDKKTERLSIRLSPALGMKLITRSRSWGRPKNRIVDDALEFWFLKPEDVRLRELQGATGGPSSFNSEPLTRIPLTEGTAVVHNDTAEGALAVRSILNGIVGGAGSTPADSTSKNHADNIVPLHPVPNDETRSSFFRPRRKAA